MRNSLKNIKLIVTDLDGTLLNSNGNITPRTIDIISKLHDKKIAFSIASGRSDKMCEVFIKKLHIDIPVISSNGALVRHIGNDNIIHKNKIHMDTVIQILEFCKFHNLDFMTYTPEKIFFTEHSKRIAKFHRYNEIARQNNFKEMNLYFYDNNFESIKNLDVIKILISEKNPTTLSNLKNFLNTLCNIEFVSSDNNLIDISTLGVSKGQALKKLAENLNLKPENIMVFGDYFNDISMFNYATHSFAMLNSLDEVKSKAKYLAPSNNDDGVAQIIEQYLL